MSDLNRRAFIGKTSGAVAGLTLVSAAKPARMFGAQGMLQVAAIGLNGVGNSNANEFIDTNRAVIVATCDVDSNVLDSRSQSIQNRQGFAPRKYADFRDVLNDDEVDAVLISTPDHWHAYMAVAACRAGKDVYVEKPCAHNVWECQYIADAALQYNRVVQHGTQQRSSTHFQRARDYIQSGQLGKVAFIKNWGILGRDSIGHASQRAVPSNLDFDLWTGPAPLHPYTNNRAHYNWRFFWDYGTGDMGNWGVHWIDTSLWLMDLGWPRAVSCSGGKRIYDDDRETADTQLVLYEYSDVTVSWELLQWSNRGNEDRDVGTEFYGEDGTLLIDRSGYQVYGRNGSSTIANVRSSNNMGLAHKHDFIDAVTNRTAPVADIESGHVSAATAILGNVALRAGERIEYDHENRRLINSDKIHLLTREYREPWDINQVVTSVNQFSKHP